MSIGINIKKRRYELRMSQQELAKAMGYKSRSTIAKIESGENDVSQKKLLKFANVLDTTVESLITGYNSSFKSYDSSLINQQVVSSKSEKNAVIILAGGKSIRNQQNVPNQFLNLLGKPVIVYCMEAYESHPAIDDIYIVCLKGWEDIVCAYAKQYNISKLREIIPAGTNGILSVKNGIDHIKNQYSKNDIIFIQESTRPMVSADMISKLLQACKEAGTATICQTMKDFVQFSIEEYSSRYINRDNIVDLQSPEAHRLSILEEVFYKAQKKQHDFDESCCTMLLYNMGYHINFIEGSINNIKIVRQEDIIICKALLSHY